LSGDKPNESINVSKKSTRDAEKMPQYQLFTTKKFIISMLKYVSRYRPATDVLLPPLIMAMRQPADKF
jgi:hypothetical protein